MNIKKSLAETLKSCSETIVSKSTVSSCGMGVEDMPKSLKENR